MTRSPEGHPGAAELPRRPTEDPLRFLIPAAHLPPGFAESVGNPVADPAPPRPAATVALVREGRGGVEVLLLRRPHRSSFAASAWVFPGGRVDAADAVLELDAHSVGPRAGEWAARLGLEDAREATGYVVAALREAWEETGILLVEEARERGSFPDARRAALAEQTTLTDLLRREGLHLATDDLLYIAHWVTPEAEPKRFDTRFFLARVAPEAECELHGDELAEAIWMDPTDAVGRATAGELKLLPPTVHTLRRLAEFSSLESLWGALREAPVPTFLPRMRPHPEGVVVEVQ